MSCAKLIPALALALAAAACTRSEPPAPPRLSSEITFRSLWWSQAQMEGLDPNAPPPKATEVALQKWEYSDPIGVPHPDVVDAVVQLRNTDQAAATGVVVDIAGQWQTGPLTAEHKAAWSDPVVLKSWSVQALAPGATATMRVPIDVNNKISELEPSRSWPWAFRVSLTLRGAGSVKPLGQGEAVLPIRPGN